MGFGSHTVDVINGSGDSTSPPEAGGFAFPIGLPGLIRDLQISTVLLVDYVASIHFTSFVYDFQVFLDPSATIA